MAEQKIVPTLSPLETHRFNLDVHRFRLPHLNDEALATILNARPDVAIVRIPANEMHKLGQTFPAPRMRPLVADTLVYYSASAKSGSPIARKNVHLEFRPGRSEDLTALAELVRKAFTGYLNHYSANRLFSAADVLDGFVEWGTGFVSNPADRKLWVVADQGRLVAFAGCRPNGRILEIVLNGVDPAQSLRGIYGDLISHILNEAKSDFDTVSISTQVHNIAVQRVWQARGFRLVGADNTIHFNLFLSGRHKPKLAFDFSSKTELALAWEKLGISEKLSCDRFLRDFKTSDLGLEFPALGRLILIDNPVFRQVRVEQRAGSPVTWVNWLQR